MTLTLLNVTTCFGSAHSDMRTDCILDLKVSDLEGMVWHHAPWKIELGKTTSEKNCMFVF